MLNEFQLTNSCLKRHQNSYTHTQIQAMKPYFCGPYNTGTKFYNFLQRARHGHHSANNLPWQGDLMSICLFQTAWSSHYFPSVYPEEITFYSVRA